MYGMIMGNMGQEDIYLDGVNNLLCLVENGLVLWEVVFIDGVGIEQYLWQVY